MPSGLPSEEYQYQGQYFPTKNYLYGCNGGSYEGVQSILYGLYNSPLSNGLYVKSKYTDPDGRTTEQ